MSPEKWQRVKGVAGAALELEAERRSRFLDQECGSDRELRSAVEDLLEGDQKAGETIEGVIAAAAAQVGRASARTGNDVKLGQTISHYRIVEKLGEGGMGVVYKAEDSKLSRMVALKFLPPHALNDEALKARFLQEAKAAAALNHPNICTIYEINKADGRDFIVMECVEGQSVKQKIEERPLKLEAALDIAIQTAEGLKAAHQKKIVHRDIKPANLMLTAEGQVKIMDFGLAQFAAQSRLTKTGTTMGTVAYMSPEQAKRLPTDRRTDIWSLGVVLYEMVTGRKPFEGEREEPVLQAIASEEPEAITALRAGVPLELDWIVGKVLAKDREERYQSAGEMIVDLRTLEKKLISGQATVLGPQSASVWSQTPTDVVVPKRKLRLHQALFVLTAVALLAVSFLYFRQTASDAPEAPLRKFTLTPPVGFSPFSVAISPNGKHIAFKEWSELGGKLWIHDVDQQHPRRIEGTELLAMRPFWSPGSDFVGFASGRELRKVSVRGGPAIRVCQIPGTIDYFRGTWNPDGNSIVFTAGSPPLLYEVPASGGTPRPLSSPEQARSSTESRTGVKYWPHFLQSQTGARVLVYATLRANEGDTLVVQDLETGQKEVLGPGTFPFYSPSGHLLYQPSFFTNEIWALPFSLDTLKATGEAFPIAQDGRVPTVSSDQTLVYGHEPTPQRQLVWLDRRGEKTGEIGPAQEDIRDPRLSPDGQRIAYRKKDGGNWELWVWGLQRRVKTRLTGGAVDSSPVWSPDGQQVAFNSRRGGIVDIHVKPADGNGEAKALVATARSEFALDWSRNGKYLLYQVEETETKEDLWYLEHDEESGEWKPHPFLERPFIVWAARFSPDGRYVAYTSNQSGQYEIYVQPFPAGGRRITVSNNGGRKPRWRKDGKELFYLEGSTLMAVPVSTEPSFSAGAPTPLFEHPSLKERWDHQYDASADGQRFVVAEEVGEAPEPSIRVVQNWFAEFRDRQGGAQ